MSVLRFADKISSSRQELLRLARGHEDGRDTWYYVKINPTKFPIYQQMMKRGEPVNLSEYGEILYSGWGTNPPEDITQKVLEEFNASAAA